MKGTWRLSPISTSGSRFLLESKVISSSSSLSGVTTKISSSSAAAAASVSPLQYHQTRRSASWSGRAAGSAVDNRDDAGLTAALAAWGDHSQSTGIIKSSEFGGRGGRGGGFRGGGRGGRGGRGRGGGRGGGAAWDEGPRFPSFAPEVHTGGEGASLLHRVGSKLHDTMRLKGSTKADGFEEGVLGTGYMRFMGGSDSSRPSSFMFARDGDLFASITHPLSIFPLHGENSEIPLDLASLAHRATVTELLSNKDTSPIYRATRDHKLSLDIPLHFFENREDVMNMTAQTASILARVGFELLDAASRRAAGASMLDFTELEKEKQIQQEQEDLTMREKQQSQSQEADGDNNDKNNKKEVNLEEQKEDKTATEKKFKRFEKRSIQKQQEHLASQIKKDSEAVNRRQSRDTLTNALAMKQSPTFSSSPNSLLPSLSDTGLYLALIACADRGPFYYFAAMCYLLGPRSMNPNDRATFTSPVIANKPDKSVLYGRMFSESIVSPLISSNVSLNSHSRGASSTSTGAETPHTMAPSSSSSSKKQYVNTSTNNNNSNNHNAAAAAADLPQYPGDFLSFHAMMCSLQYFIPTPEETQARMSGAQKITRDKTPSSSGVLGSVFSSTIAQDKANQKAGAELRPTIYYVLDRCVSATFYQSLKQLAHATNPEANVQCQQRVAFDNELGVKISERFKSQMLSNSRIRRHHRSSSGDHKNTKGASSSFSLTADEAAAQEQEQQALLGNNVDDNNNDNSLLHPATKLFGIKPPSSSPSSTAPLPPPAGISEPEKIDFNDPRTQLWKHVLFVTRALPSMCLSTVHTVKFNNWRSGLSKYYEDKTEEELDSLTPSLKDLVADGVHPIAKLFVDVLRHSKHWSTLTYQQRELFDIFFSDALQFVYRQQQIAKRLVAYRLRPETQIYYSTFDSLLAVRKIDLFPETSAVIKSCSISSVTGAVEKLETTKSRQNRERRRAEAIKKEKALKNQADTAEAKLLAKSINSNNNETAADDENNFDDEDDDIDVAEVEKPTATTATTTAPRAVSRKRSSATTTATTATGDVEGEQQQQQQQQPEVVKSVGEMTPEEICQAQDDVCASSAHAVITPNTTSSYSHVQTTGSHILSYQERFSNLGTNEIVKELRYNGMADPRLRDHFLHITDVAMNRLNNEANAFFSLKREEDMYVVFRRLIYASRLTKAIFKKSLFAVDALRAKCVNVWCSLMEHDATITARTVRLDEVVILFQQIQALRETHARERSRKQRLEQKYLTNSNSDHQQNKQQPVQMFTHKSPFNPLYTDREDDRVKQTKDIAASMQNSIRKNDWSPEGTTSTSDSSSISSNNKDSSSPPQHENNNNNNNVDDSSIGSTTATHDLINTNNNLTTTSPPAQAGESSPGTAIDPARAAQCFHTALRQAASRHWRVMVCEPDKITSLRQESTINAGCFIEFSTHFSRLTHLINHIDNLAKNIAHHELPPFLPGHTVQLAYSIYDKAFQELTTSMRTIAETLDSAHNKFVFGNPDPKLTTHKMLFDESLYPANEFFTMPSVLNSPVMQVHPRMAELYVTLFMGPNYYFSSDYTGPFVTPRNTNPLTADYNAQSTDEFVESKKRLINELLRDEAVAQSKQQQSSVDEGGDDDDKKASNNRARHALIQKISTNFAVASAQAEERQNNGVEEEGEGNQKQQNNKSSIDNIKHQQLQSRTIGSLAAIKNLSKKELKQWKELTGKDFIDSDDAELFRDAEGRYPINEAQIQSNIADSWTRIVQGLIRVASCYSYSLGTKHVKQSARAQSFKSLVETNAILCSLLPEMLKMSKQSSTFLLCEYIMVLVNAVRHLRLRPLMLDYLSSGYSSTGEAGTTVRDNITRGLLMGSSSSINNNSSTNSSSDFDSSSASLLASSRGPMELLTATLDECHTVLIQAMAELSGLQDELAADDIEALLSITRSPRIREAFMEVRNLREGDNENSNNDDDNSNTTTASRRTKKFKANFSGTIVDWSGKRSTFRKALSTAVEGKTPEEAEMIVERMLREEPHSKSIFEPTTRAMRAIGDDTTTTATTTTSSDHHHQQQQQVEKGNDTNDNNNNNNNTLSQLSSSTAAASGGGSFDDGWGVLDETKRSVIANLSRETILSISRQIRAYEKKQSRGENHTSAAVGSADMFSLLRQLRSNNNNNNNNATTTTDAAVISDDVVQNQRNSNNNNNNTDNKNNNNNNSTSPVFESSGVSSSESDMKFQINNLKQLLDDEMSRRQLSRRQSAEKRFQNSFAQFLTPAAVSSSSAGGATTASGKNFLGKNEQMTTLNISKLSYANRLNAAKNSPSNEMLMGGTSSFTNNGGGDNNSHQSHSRDPASRSLFISAGHSLETLYLSLGGSDINTDNLEKKYINNLDFVLQSSTSRGPITTSTTTTTPATNPDSSDSNNNSNNNNNNNNNDDDTTTTASSTSAAPPTKDHVLHNSLLLKSWRQLHSPLFVPVVQTYRKKSSLRTLLAIVQNRSFLDSAFAEGPTRLTKLYTFFLFQIARAMYLRAPQDSGDDHFRKLSDGVALCSDESAPELRLLMATDMTRMLDFTPIAAHVKHAGAELKRRSSPDSPYYDPRAGLDQAFGAHPADASGQDGPSSSAAYEHRRRRLRDNQEREQEDKGDNDGKKNNDGGDDDVVSGKKTNNLGEILKTDFSYENLQHNKLLEAAEKLLSLQQQEKQQEGVTNNNNNNKTSSSSSQHQQLLRVQSSRPFEYLDTMQISDLCPSDPRVGNNALILVYGEFCNTNLSEAAELNDHYDATITNFVPTPQHAERFLSPVSQIGEKGAVAFQCVLSSLVAFPIESYLNVDTRISHINTLLVDEGMKQHYDELHFNKLNNEANDKIVFTKLPHVMPRLMNYMENCFAPILNTIFGLYSVEERCRVICRFFRREKHIVNEVVFDHETEYERLARFNRRSKSSSFGSNNNNNNQQQHVIVSQHQLDLRRSQIELSNCVKIESLLFAFTPVVNSITVLLLKPNDPEARRKMEDNDIKCSKLLVLFDNLCETLTHDIMLLRLNPTNCRTVVALLRQVRDTQEIVAVRKRNNADDNNNVTPATTTKTATTATSSASYLSDISQNLLDMCEAALEDLERQAVENEEEFETVNNSDVNNNNINNSTTATATSGEDDATAAADVKASCEATKEDEEKQAATLRTELLEQIQTLIDGNVSVCRYSTWNNLFETNNTNDPQQQANTMNDDNSNHQFLDHQQQQQHSDPRDFLRKELSLSSKSVRRVLSEKTEITRTVFPLLELSSEIDSRSKLSSSQLVGAIKELVPVAEIFLCAENRHFVALGANDQPAASHKLTGLVNAALSATIELFLRTPCSIPMMPAASSLSSSSSSPAPAPLYNSLEDLHLLNQELTLLSEAAKAVELTLTMGLTFQMITDARSSMFVDRLLPVMFTCLAVARDKMNNLIASSSSSSSSENNEATTMMMKYYSETVRTQAYSTAWSIGACYRKCITAHPVLALKIVEASNGILPKNFQNMMNLNNNNNNTAVRRLTLLKTCLSSSSSSSSSPNTTGNKNNQNSSSSSSSSGSTSSEEISSELKLLSLIDFSLTRFIFSDKPLLATDNFIRFPQGFGTRGAERPDHRFTSSATRVARQHCPLVYNLSILPMTQQMLLIESCTINLRENPFGCKSLITDALSVCESMIVGYEGVARFITNTSLEISKIITAHGRTRLDIAEYYLNNNSNSAAATNKNTTNNNSSLINLQQAEIDAAVRRQQKIKEDLEKEEAETATAEKKQEGGASSSSSVSITTQQGKSIRELTKQEKELAVDRLIAQVQSDLNSSSSSSSNSAYGLSAAHISASSLLDFVGGDSSSSGTKEGSGDAAGSSSVDFDMEAAIMKHRRDAADKYVEEFSQRLGPYRVCEIIPPSSSASSFINTSSSTATTTTTANNNKNKTLEDETIMISAFDIIRLIGLLYVSGQKDKVVPLTNRFHSALHSFGPQKEWEIRHFKAVINYSPEQVEKIRQQQRDLAEKVVVASLQNDGRVDVSISQQLNALTSLLRETNSYVLTRVIRHEIEKPPVQDMLEHHENQYSSLLASLHGSSSSSDATTAENNNNNTSVVVPELSGDHDHHQNNTSSSSPSLLLLQNDLELHSFSETLVTLFALLDVVEANENKMHSRSNTMTKSFIVYAKTLLMLSADPKLVSSGNIPRLEKMLPLVDFKFRRTHAAATGMASANQARVKLSDKLASQAIELVKKM